MPAAPAASWTPSTAPRRASTASSSSPAWPPPAPARTAAPAQAAAAEAAVSGRAYFVDDGRTYSWRDLLDAVQEAVGSRALAFATPRFAHTAAALAAELYGLLPRRAVSLTREKGLEMSQRHWGC